MSYQIAFEIQDTSEIKIPAYFIKEFKEIEKVFEDQIEPLEKLSEDEMTVSQMKVLEKLKGDMKNIVIELSDKFNVTRNEYLVDDKEYTMFWDKKNKTLQLFHEEGESFDFILEGDYFVGYGSFYSKSNHGWAKEMIEYLLQKFNGSAIIKDMGDEERGFEGEDGLDEDEELDEDEVWENGVMK